MSSNTSNKRISFASTKNQLQYPDFLEVQLKSFKDFFQLGTAPENIRHFIELRGIGIINARRIFGMGAVKLTETGF